VDAEAAGDRREEVRTRKRREHLENLERYRRRYG
jgi:hypothetical protein